MTMLLTVKTRNMSYGIEYQKMNTWLMLSRNVTTVLKEFFIRWLMLKGSAGMLSQRDESDTNSKAT